MYKCKECGCEYENKPDFCDCGNDEFILVETENKTSNKQMTPTNSTTSQQAKQQTEQNYINQNIENKSYKEKYSPLFKITKSVEPISLFIFIICLILSAIICSIKIEQPETVQKENKIVTRSDIPTLDKFWDNSLPENKVLTTEKPKKKEILINQPVVKENTTKTTVLKSAKNQNTKQQTTVKKSNTNNTQPKKSVTTTQNKQSQNNQPVKTTTQPKEQNAQVLKQTPAEQKIVQQIIKQEPQVDYAKIKAELENYKASLRNTIGRKIDFTRVVGDGSCTVSFKISSDGKLINRSFSQQSSNITLNDAVYSAIMSTPTFKAPPEGYKNETFNLNIKFYNGNFEIILK